MKLQRILVGSLVFALAPTALVGAQEIGRTYCTSSANSTGQAGLIHAYGVPEQTTGNVILVATQCPPSQVGIFFYGPNRANLPFADGTLCISPANGGIRRIQPPLRIDSAGSVAHHLTSAEISPWPGGTSSPLVLDYQFWFRDTAAGNTGSNLTSAVEIEFLACDSCK